MTQVASAVLSVAIDKHGSTPVYIQIAEGLRAAIRKASLQRGHMLPPERVLCEQMGVSRMTLRQGYDLLQREGLIDCLRGRGTFVAVGRFQKQEQQVRGFTEDMLARGSTPSSQLLSFRVIHPSLEAKAFFGLPNEQMLYEIQRLRYCDGVPLALETSQLPCRLCPGLDRFNLATQSLYKILEEEYQIRILRAVEEISAIRANKRHRELLCMPSTAVVLTIRRRIFTAQDNALELCLTGYRGDLYTAIVHSWRSKKRP